MMIYIRVYCQKAQVRNVVSFTLFSFTFLAVMPVILLNV